MIVNATRAFKAMKASLDWIGVDQVGREALQQRFLSRLLTPVLSMSTLCALLYESRFS